MADCELEECESYPMKDYIDPTTHPDIVLKFAVLDGKKIAYTNKTVFYVELGNGRKGKWNCRYKFIGNLTQAVMYYNGINIGPNVKKRLYGEFLNKPVLARQTGW